MTFSWIGKANAKTQSTPRVDVNMYVYMYIYIYGHPSPKIYLSDFFKWYLHVYIYIYIYLKNLLYFCQSRVCRVLVVLKRCHQTPSQVVRDKALRNHRMSCWYYIHTHIIYIYVYTYIMHIYIYHVYHI